LRKIKAYHISFHTIVCQQTQTDFIVEQKMTTASVMVHVEVEAPCDDRIKLAAGVASRFHGTLTGVTAWEPRPPLTYGGVIVDSTPTEGKLQQMSDRLNAVEKHFRAVVGEQQPTEWRTGLESPTDFLVSQARAADLLIIGRDRVPGDLYRSLDPGATILMAGRPVLVVPSGVDSLELRNVVIGWKDTREARRALQDALPLLGDAKRVSIIGVGETDLEDQTRRQIDDVANYLGRHRIDVVTRTTVHAAGPASKELLRVAQDEKADLIVAGGYGHSRLGEWIFGGVTQDLLAASPICCLLSH
jgi:nucleotide-binding universal stress UspA family protein